MEKKSLARAAVNDIGCPAPVKDSRSKRGVTRCSGVAFIPITLRELARIKAGSQRRYNGVTFHCGHKHNVTLTG